MSWRGQGGRRAKGRRGDQDPELDNTAWLAELEREAAEAEDDEDDWASTLRGRRGPAAPPPGPAPPADPGWSPTGPAPSEHRPPAAEPPPAAASPWSPDPPPEHLPPAPPPADPDWAWRPPASDAFAEPDPDPFTDPRPDPGSDAGWAGPDDGGWRPAGADTPTGIWSPADPPAPDPGYPNGQVPDLDYPNGQGPADPGYPAGRSPADPQSAYPDAPASADPAALSPGYAAEEADYPVGREPDYPALFGELYRRSAGQQDPIWEAPPAAEPLPEPGQPEPSTGSWPFEESPQSWEPSDRSFIWPPDELPAAPAEWDTPAPAPWLDEPPPQAPPPAPAAPPPVAASGPPPADWASAIPTDVPAAHRTADSTAATRMWRPDQAEHEPGVPLGAGPATTATRAGDYAPADEPGEVRRKGSPARRKRPAGERRARTWPRVVAIVAWIVFLMVVCWYYVFPWLERVLPESF
jgi:hypothetical protein